jgi:hypothetical protein
VRRHRPLGGGWLAVATITDQEKISLTVTIEAFVAALARTENAIVTAQERTGVAHDEFWRSQEAALVTAMETGQYPHMADLDEDAFAATHEQVFEFGLRAILDGPKPGCGPAMPTRLLWLASPARSLPKVTWMPNRVDTGLPHRNRLIRDLED